MKLKWVIAVVCLLIQSTSFAKSASDMTEFNFLRLHQAKTFEQAVKLSAMSEKHKKDVMAYLRGHELTDKKPLMMKWNGETEISFVGKKSSYKIDYAPIAKNQIVVKGKTITFAKEALFSEMVKQVQAALAGEKKSQKKSAQSLWISQAVAGVWDLEVVDPSVGIMDIVMYVTGLDQLAACVGAENNTNSDCVFRDDASMIKGEVSRPNFEILTFECKNEKLQRFSFDTEFDGRRVLDVDYQENGTPKTITLSEPYNGRTQTLCRYDLDENGALLHDVYPQRFCHYGKAEGRVESDIAWLNKGEKPRSFNNVPVTLTRLNNCCANTKCRKEIGDIGKAKEKRDKEGREKYLRDMSGEEGSGQH
jgi:hypothetical protein